MLEKFPELQKGQIALSRADINTGIVLDEQYLYATKPSQKIYTIFNNINEALEYAKKIIEERSDVECYIHENEKTLIHYLDYKTLNKNGDKIN